MVLKKPYAFLIKHFRLIHLFSAIPIIYLAYKSTNIVTFFGDYVTNNYSLTVNGNLQTMFINALMYLSIILIILGSMAIYLLFKYKEKPRNNYIAIIIYYLIFFVLLNITHSILGVMEAEAIEASLARSYRDISLLFVLPQYYFSIFVILRGLGFNVKKLNFASDLKELEISEKDSEEFEFVVGVEGYKAKRTFRRFIREFSYYLKENTFIVIAIVLMILIGAGTSIYLNREDYELNYDQGEVFDYKTFSISVEDSITTNLTYNGVVLNKDKYYLIVKINITNNLNEPALLEHTNFRIKINNEFLYPIIDKASYFADYAIPYNGKELKALEQDSYVLVYELREDQLTSKYELKVYNGFSEKKGEIKTRYSNVELTPILIDGTSEVRSVKLKEKLDLTNSNIGNTILTINEYQITNKYTYKYELCYNESCKNYTDYVAVDLFSTGQGSTLLALKYDLILDTTSAYSHYIKSEKTFFDNFVSIRYKIGDSVYNTKAINQTPTNLENTLVLQISNQIKNAYEIEILVTIRNKIYSIRLK